MIERMYGAAVSSATHRQPTTRDQTETLPWRTGARNGTGAPDTLALPMDPHHPQFLPRPELPPMRFRTSAALLLTGIVPFTACTDRASAPTEAEPAEASFARGGGQAGVQFIARRNPDVLVTLGDVVVSNSGYGSGMALKPGSARDFYLLTDRGPNYDGPAGSPTPKRFPDPSFAPRIYPAHIAGSKLKLGTPIILKGPDGTPMSGLPIPGGDCGSTNEVGQTVDGTPLAADPLGLDPEGIVAMADGTFWVSDEYGPFMVHFDANGRELRRFAPCGASPELPAVYAKRRPNRGMEGLTITPDGQWLVGIMQSPLQNPSGAAVSNSVVTRILFKHINDGTTKEYLYLLDRSNLQGNSEILALSSTRFLVIERDGRFLFGTPAADLKKIYEVDISGATDVSALGGFQQYSVGGTKTLEQASPAELAMAGIKAGIKTLRVDLLALGYPHDKPEGLALAPGGWLFVINDDDFGIVGQGGELGQKFLPPSAVEPDAPALWQIKLR